MSSGRGRDSPGGRSGGSPAGQKCCLDAAEVRIRHGPFYRESFRNVGG